MYLHGGFMKNKSINQVSIINGEDGPTSVFIFGEAQKQSLKIRIRNAIYQSRRKRIEKRIAANPHTLAEVVQYAKDHYDLVEMAFGWRGDNGDYTFDSLFEVVKHSHVEQYVFLVAKKNNEDKFITGGKKMQEKKQAFM